MPCPAWTARCGSRPSAVGSRPCEWVVFHAGRLESAPVQLVPVPNPDGTEISSGAVVEVAQGIHARLQKVVYTGVYLNSISSIDIRQSTFTADLYLWMRFAGDTSPGAADPARIEFPELVRGHFEPDQPVARGDLDDGTTYRLWHISGDFQNRFDLRDYPVDHQTLAVRFFHATAASDRLVYIQDTRAQGGRPAGQAPPSSGGATAGGFGQAAATSFFPAIATPHDPLSIAAPDAFTGLTRWAPLNVNKRRDILVTESALGDPRLVGLARHRELSGFMVTVDVARRVWAVLLKTLLPLGLMTLILLASLYFSAALVQEKITVAVTAALSGAVLLSSIDEQLGSIGYTVRIEYLFYAFFTLCLLCIVSIMLADRCRLAKRDTLAVSVEQATRILFLLSMLATVFTGWSISHLP